MKTKVVSCVVTVVGVLALSATVAQAGGGPGTTRFSAFFECQNIEGAAPVNEDVSIRDPNDKNIVLHPVVKVGTAQLACRQVQVRDLSADENLIAPPVGEALKCYSIAVHGPQGDPHVLDFADVGFGAETDVRVTGSRYLCGTTDVSE